MNPDNILIQDRVIPSEFVKRILENKNFLETMLFWLNNYEDTRMNLRSDIQRGIDDMKGVIQQKMRNDAQLKEYIRSLNPA